MKTQKELETIKNTYETSEILINLFAKYKNYDSKLEEHYDSNSLFGKTEKTSITTFNSNDNASIVEYKESLLEKIINKIKRIFTK